MIESIGSFIQRFQGSTEEAFFKVKLKMYDLGYYEEIEVQKSTTLVYIITQLLEKVSFHHTKLMFGDKELKRNIKLSDIGVTAGSILELVRTNSDDSGSYSISDPSGSDSD